MLNRLKEWLRRVINMLAVLVMVALVGLHIGTAGIIMTGVVNAWRLDSYITPTTGVGVVVLIFMVVWAPLWFMRRLDR